MAIVDDEVIAATVAFNIYFSVEELEAMLGNTKAGGYTAVRIETNGGASKVTVEMK